MDKGALVANIPSLEELQKLYEGSGGKGSVAGEKDKPKKKAKVKPPPVVSAETNVQDSQAYCDLHFWLRENDNWQSVLQDAKTEVNVRGANVLVFAHSHSRGNSCSHLCRQVKGE